METDAFPKTREIVTATYTAVNIANDLDTPEWRRAQPVKIDRYWSGEPAPAARVAWLVLGGFTTPLLRS